MTSPASASVSAARSPAMPLPMTRKSPRTSTAVSYQCTMLEAQSSMLNALTGYWLGIEHSALSTETRAAGRIDVETGTRSSAIWIGEGIAEQLPSLLDAHGVGKRRFIVSSPVIWRLHGKQLQHAGNAGEPILIPDGERFKNLQSVSRIYESLIRAGADRGSAIVAVGGGVVGDTAGFAAAAQLRGIALAHVPTTLLAQVDRSIGGKVGVNHALAKNMIGAFHQPAVVAIDPLLLRTLPRREFRSGLYEVVKYGMIASRELFDRVAHHTKEIFAKDPDRSEER